MTWEEFVRIATASNPVEYGPCERSVSVAYDVELCADGDVAAEQCSLKVSLDVWIAWGRYCETLKAEMDRCNGAGICGGPVKVEANG